MLVEIDWRRVECTENDVHYLYDQCYFTSEELLQNRYAEWNEPHICNDYGASQPTSHSIPTHYSHWSKKYHVRLGNMHHKADVPNVPRDIIAREVLCGKTVGRAGILSQFPSLHTAPSLISIRMSIYSVGLIVVGWSRDLKSTRATWTALKHLILKLLQLFVNSMVPWCIEF